MTDQDEKRRKAAEASRRWREANHERYKQVARDAFHRRQARLGKKKAVRFETDEERVAARRAATRKWQAKNRDHVNAVRKATYHKNPEMHRAKARAWYAANRERAQESARWQLIKKRYGLTKEQYEAMGTQCEICGSAVDGRTKKQSGKRFRLAVDHDKVSGKVRGLLCGNCNCGIGFFNHDLALLNTAIEYLKKHQ